MSSVTLSNLEEIDPDNNYLKFSDERTCNYYSLKEFDDLAFVKDFTVLNYNIRSFRRNFEHFSDEFGFERFPCVLTLTETWTSNDCDASIYDIPGYQAFHTIRDGRSGGVSIYVKNNLKCSFVPNLSYCTVFIEICSVEIKFGSFSCVIVGIYRPHSGTTTEFIHHFNSILNHSNFRNKCVLIMGDFNINLLNENRDSNDLLNSLYSNHFVSLINKPTRFSQIETVLPTLLDHIYVIYSSTQL